MRSKNKTNNHDIVFIFISSDRAEDNDLRWSRLRQISDPVEPATENEKEIKAAVKKLEQSFIKVYSYKTPSSCEENLIYKYSSTDPLDWHGSEFF